MKTKEKIIAALQELKTLSDATFEEIEDEIRKTSTCVLVDASEIKEAGKWIELHNGKIGTFIEVSAGKLMKIQCSFRQLVSQNIIAAEEGDTRDQFVKDARQLASMLLKAASKFETRKRN